MVTPLMPERKTKTSLAHNVSRIRLRKENVINEKCTYKFELGKSVAHRRDKVSNADKSSKLHL